MSSNSAFWYPASKPSSEELQHVLLTTVARNIFCTHHASATQELARLKRKRKHEECGVDGPSIGGGKEEEEVVGTLTAFDTITFLVRASGICCESQKRPNNSRSKLPLPQTDNGASTEQPDNDKSLKDERGTTDPPKTRSVLASLIEGARAKERLTAKRDLNDRGDGRDVRERTALKAFEVASMRTSSSISRGDNLASGGDGDEFDVDLPLDPHIREDAPSASQVEGLSTKHPLQMTREEFLCQFKRAPRRGEIGYDAESVAAAEAVGYVMSGSRNKEKQHYVDRIQQKLHEKEARKLRLQFRKVEDERNDRATVESLLMMMHQKMNTGND
ncbi:hypothetical protein TRVL_07049 [Trypanosoma vivax]|nr:hypothetical protein TRVL_07049 [Trypanosoma vivax]